MARLGVFLLGIVVTVLVGGMAVKPAMDKLYTIMNGTGMPSLSGTEQVVWQLMPYLIPAILFGILVAYLTGKIGGGRKDEYWKSKE